MTLEKVLDKIHHFYPPLPHLYANDGFYKSAFGKKVYEAWEKQNEAKLWLPFVEQLNQQTALQFGSIYRGNEFCFKAWGNFSKYSAHSSITTTIVISLSTIIPYHCIYLCQQQVGKHPLRTFFNNRGHSLNFVKPCFSAECQHIHKSINQVAKQKGITNTLQTCAVQPEALILIKDISTQMAQAFSTKVLPLEWVNIQVPNIAEEYSYGGDVSIYTAAFSPHVV